MKQSQSLFRLFYTGLCMGAADIVPGVSGGTIAFVMGIYSNLIESIKSITSKTLKLALKLKIKDAFFSINWGFLLPVFAGIATSIVTLAKPITYLLDHHPSYIWGFFFGLVLASVLLLRNNVKNWNLKNIIGLLSTTILAYIISGMLPGTTPDTLPLYFATGFIAIIAMILPGISGSFIMVLLGKYNQVISALTDLNIPVILVFITGCIVGISTFSRVLSWLLAKHYEITIAVLIGFMVGSLRKVWPWKEVISTTVDRHGDIVPLLEKNIIPPIDTNFFFVIGLMTAGLVLMWQIEKLQKNRE